MFVGLSIRSLAATETIRPLRCSQDGGFPWLGGQTRREVLILGSTIGRFWSIIRILLYDHSGLTWRMYRILWVKYTTSAECKIYSNSRVRGYGHVGKVMLYYYHEFCWMNLLNWIYWTEPLLNYWWIIVTLEITRHHLEQLIELSLNYYWEIKLALCK